MRVTKSISVKSGLVAMGAALAITACAPSNEEIIAQNVRPTCPQVAAIADWDKLTRFKDNASVDITDISYEARISSVKGNCYYETALQQRGLVSRTLNRFSDDNNSGTGRIVTDFEIEVEVERGPAGTERNISIPLRMLLVDSFDRVKLTRDFKADFAFDKEFSRATWRSQYSQTLPANGPAAGAGWEVLVAIRLTPEEVEFNKNN